MYIDYVRKAEVLASGLTQKVKKIDKAYYADDCLRSTGEIIRSSLTLEEASTLKTHLLSEYGQETYHEAEKVNKAEWQRTGRLKETISLLLNAGHCLFLTLTFRDDVFKTTNADTRRQYVRRYLNEFDAPYVANIDFGKEKGREHYHAVILLDKIDFMPWFVKYGVLKAKHVRNKDGDDRRLAKYISKLTNHAIKETAKRNSIIYSRGKGFHFYHKLSDFQKSQLQNERDIFSNAMKSRKCGKDKKQSGLCSRP